MRHWVCFQYREDALCFQDALRKRLERFGLMVEPTKTKLVEYGPFAQHRAAKHGRRRPERIYFVSFTLILPGQIQSVGSHRELTLAAQPYVTARTDAVDKTSYDQTTNRRAQWHFMRPLGPRVGPNIARCRRCIGLSGVTGSACHGTAPGLANASNGTDFHQIKEKIPPLRPELRLPNRARCRLSRYCKATLEECSAVAPHATFCGNA